ncbi:MAG: DNA polymerase III subunit beta [Prevotella micans]|jgi:hypothetical protein|nr:DNA polymerase III subunit beta [Prevotella micans]
MRFTISSTALNSRLLSLSRVINSKNTLPILDCFLFEVRGGQLIVTASDSENVMQSTMPLESFEGEGMFAVNSQTIIDAVKELPEQPLNIDINLGELKIYVTYQNGYYDFPIQNAEEYPQVQAVDEGAISMTIDSGVLADNISRSLFATAQDELRPVMNGIYFDLTADYLAIVASDGHKLVRNKNLNIKSDAPSAFILPKKPATLLKNVLVKDGSNVMIRFDQHSAEITFTDGKLNCRLIEGRYPNYDSVIPKDNPNHIVIDRKSFIGALRRVLPFSSDSSQLIRYKVGNGQLELSAEDVDFSTRAKESITCEYEGTPMQIGFKGSSMLEILNNLQSENVAVRLADPSRAGVIEPDGQEENQEILMLIMPMLLND